jgi:hypothetical protein
VRRQKAGAELFTPNQSHKKCATATSAWRILQHAWYQIAAVKKRRKAQPAADTTLITANPVVVELPPVVAGFADEAITVADT